MRYLSNHLLSLREDLLHSIAKMNVFPSLTAKCPGLGLGISGVGKFLLATCQQLKEEQKAEATPSSQDRARLPGFVPGRDKNKQPGRARLPWKVGTSIIHLMNGDLGLKRTGTTSPHSQWSEKGAGLRREPTLSISGLCTFPSAIFLLQGTWRGSLLHP